MHTPDPFAPQDTVVVSRLTVEEKYKAPVSLRFWLDEKGFENVVFSEPGDLHGVVVFTANNPPRANEACFAVTRAGVLAAGIQALELDEFGRILVQRHILELRRRRTAGWSPRAWFWTVAYALWPRIGGAL